MKQIGNARQDPRLNEVNIHDDGRNMFWTLLCVLRIPAYIFASIPEKESLPQLLLPQLTGLWP